MLWLGNWQLDKWERRNAQLAAYAARDGQTTKAVTDLRDGNLTQFDKVALELSFDAKRQILIDSIVKDGKNGFYVISLAFTGDNQPLLVNRGWIAQTPTREPPVTSNCPMCPCLSPVALVGCLSAVCVSATSIRTCRRGLRSCIIQHSKKPVGCYPWNWPTGYYWPKADQARQCGASGHPPDCRPSDISATPFSGLHSPQH